ncbi:DUF4402 domain-containing protein [Novosphingobium sp. KA1]|uniref:DUF4402 domain-containing protein n=1 Tax=Novosphingobium sp. (strain KA1) TaxID=164608 RepID=UPI001A9023E2|nr:DUF4402 domain-containing protein [Novosphingobium sp. KA1]QSR17675.1 hypothetical protein CA833_10835 [Novosphingobium sp. KA1]
MPRSPALPVTGGLLAAEAVGLAVGMALMAPACALAAEAPAGAYSSGIASATVVAPLAVRSLSDLDFGAVGDVGREGGSLVIVPGSTQARYGGAARLACPVGEETCAMPHAARLRVEGEPGRAYRVLLPDAVEAQSVAADGAPLSRLPVSSLTVRTDSRPQSDGQGVLGEDGGDGFEIGGELDIPPGTRASHYRAQVPVIVVYG